jgi:hypothetical protein
MPNKVNAQVKLMMATLDESRDEFIKQLTTVLKNNNTTTNVMASLFQVFKQSIDSMNEDTRYWTEKLALANAIGDALADRLKELNDAMAGSEEKDDEDDCKESWRLVLQQQQRELATLAETAQQLRKTTLTMLKQLD